MGVVADLADRVAVMYRGEIVEQGVAQQIFAHPRHPYTRHLLAAVPHLGQPRPASMDATPAPAVIDRAIVEVNHLDIDFPGRLGAGPVHAVRDVSLQVLEHEILALVGESGSGKTTLGRATVGLVKPTRGQITVLGSDIALAKGNQLRQLRRQIGFVFQDPAASLNPRLTVGACIGEPLRVHQIGSPDQRQAKVKELLEAVELPADYAQRYPHELSGGQRQRVSLARALVLGPKFLVADEPTSALDVSVQAKVLDVFVRLQHELGFSCLFVTHDLAVVDLLADRVAVMEGGILVELGDSSQVLRHPRQRYTQTLLAAVPLPDPLAQAAKRTARRAQATPSPA
jgi:ABC-type glutathione transport system ATPase component